MSPVAVYIHTPFCPSKCGYCDFNSYAMTGEIVDRTTAAQMAELERSPWRGRPAKTIFFGGGTPTFLSADQLTGLLKKVMEIHPPIDGCEITSEANPGTVDAEKFAAMRDAGFNRLSLGAQSFQSEDLIRLGRVHAAGEVGKAVGAARKAGFDNINLDLMFALPGQTLSAWRQNLDLALTLRPEHLSLYCLTIEPNTRYYKLDRRGMLDLPSDDAQVAMYDLACERTAAAGMGHYEISNFAAPGRECAHNLCYWRAEDYAGYGPGAVGTMDGERYTVLKHPVGYSEAVENGDPIWFDREPLTDENRHFERVMLGLRLSEGLSSEGLMEGRIAELVRRGWIEADADRVRLTANGRHFCSEAALELS